MSRRARLICAGCGKTLTDPFSISVGIGPVCRMKEKLREFDEQPGTDLFKMAKVARYEAWVEDRIVCVIDLDSGRSVTNDAEGVVRHIMRDMGDSYPGLIIYRDLNGIWDQLVVQAFRFAGFRALNTTDMEEAKRIVAGKRVGAAVLV